MAPLQSTSATPRRGDAIDRIIHDYQPSQWSDTPVLPTTSMDIPQHTLSTCPLANLPLSPGSEEQCASDCSKCRARYCVDNSMMGNGVVKHHLGCIGFTISSVNGQNLMTLVADHSSEMAVPPDCAFIARRHYPSVGLFPKRVFTSLAKLR